MKTKNFLIFTFMLLSFVLMSHKSVSSVNVTEDNCTNWQKGTTQIQFRWCTDPAVMNNTSYQFYNGYTFEVHYFFQIDYTNGEPQPGTPISMVWQNLTKDQCIKENL